MDNFTIRRARPEDNEGVIRLLLQIADLHHRGRPDMFKEGSKKYGKDEFISILNDETRPVFIAADENGGILGYCFCMLARVEGHPVFRDHNSLYIDDFCVEQSLRGQGIGKRIFSEALEFAKGAGVHNIDLNVWEFNGNAIKFYESCGFQTQRRRMEMVL